MRILAIRGAHLASLPEFDIDLEAEPLAGAGLFAITGDTGAGKSTILDAICLALYGDYPRVSVAKKSEKVVDADGKEITATDTGNILRRGANRGFAEVDFIGRDNVGYRARWELRRASGKANGRLQNVERRLDRLDGSGSVASGLRDVTDAIVERTGLSFDQFRRTALLAQGEFDAFLLADEARRAELLETITGTEIYSRISQRVFEGTAKRQSEVKLLDARRGEIGVLDEVGRTALIAAHAEEVEALEACGLRANAIEGQLAHARDVLALQKLLADAKERLQQAIDASTAAEPERLRLVALRKAEQLRAKSEALAAARRASAQANSIAEAARLAETQALAADAAASMKLGEVQSAGQQSETAVRQLEPLWEQATVLDEAVRRSEAELVRARHIEGGAKQRSDEAKSRHAAEVRTLADVTANHGKLAEALAKRGAQKETAARIEWIDRQLANLTSLTLRRRAAEQARTRNAAERGTIGQRLAAARLEIDTQNAELQRLDAQLATARAAGGRIDLVAVSQRESGLRSLESDLARLEALCLRRDEALQLAQVAKTAAATAATEAAGAQSRLVCATEAYAGHKAARDALQPLADLANETLSKSAGRMRSVLVDGEPCPVCGAKEHPFAHDDGEATKLAREIRSRRDAVDIGLEVAAHEMQAAQSQVAGSLAQQKAQTSRADVETERARAAAIELRRLVPPFGSKLRAILPAHPAGASVLAGDDLLASAIGATKSAVATEIASAASARDAAELLRRNADALQASVDKWRTATKLANEGAIDDEKRLVTLDGEAQGLDATSAALREQIVAAQTELQPYLKAADVAEGDVERNTAAVRSRVAAIAAEYRQLATESERLSGEIVTGTQLRTTLEAAAQTAASLLVSARSVAAERQAERDALAGERAALLGGEATATHRARHLNALSENRKAEATARQARADASAALAGHRTARVLAAEAIAAAESQARELATIFEAGLAATGLTPADAQALLAVSAVEVAALTDRLDAIGRQLAGAKSLHEARGGDLQKLLAERSAPEAAAVTALESEHAALLGQIEARRNALADIRHALQGDEELRRRADELASEIDVKKVDLLAWEEVNAAIGQADGAKFRRYAQGVTLSELVALANRQLEALNPRYALRAGSTTALAIDIVDHDTGDDIRGVRSLSGGERFLVSLALALALAGLEGRQSFVDTLFIDEGFGALDRETLDMAIATLETLQSQGRKVGVITHVQAMIERIPVQIRVVKRGGGKSTIHIENQGNVLTPGVP